jgi:hypothetical protein
VASGGGLGPRQLPPTQSPFPTGGDGSMAAAIGRATVVGGGARGAAWEADWPQPLPLPPPPPRGARRLDLVACSDQIWWRHSGATDDRVVCIGGAVDGGPTGETDM